MFSHPLARQLETWWKANGADANNAAWQRYLVELAALLEIKLNEIGEEHSNTGADGDKRFGMSKAAGCTRQAALKFLGHKGEPFTGSTLMTFHIGHLLECSAVATMRAAGYEVGGTQEPVRIDPMMHSYSDGIIKDFDERGDAILSVKTAGYKGSSMLRGKPMRRGFPALPFDGIRKAQPSWWAQAQAEMHGSGIPRCIVLVVSKDIVKAMEGDPYLMGEPGKGNGSLTFYAEMIEYDQEFCDNQLLPVWSNVWDSVTDGKAGPAWFFNGSTVTYARLPKPGDVSEGWGGANKVATGSFNPCFGCDYAAVCKAELANDYRR